MKKHLVAIGVSAGLALGANAANAEGWKFLPVKDPDYVAEPTAELIVGIMEPDSDLGGNAVTYGAEISANCILLQPPKNRIRTTIGYTHYDDGGLVLNNFEVNPHYVVEVTPDFWLGGGPGLGAVLADADQGEDSALFALQLGLSAHYRVGMLFIGGDARYQWTQSKNVGLTDEGADNWRVAAKVGLNF